MIEFGVLGPLRVCRNGSTVPGLNALLIRRLLAALLSRANALIPVDELTQAIWGHHPPPTSRKTLQVYVRRLRAVLGDDQIAHEADGYRIEIRDHQLDAAAFAHLVNAARQEERKDRAAELLEQALGLWRGSAFEDVREHSPLAEEARRLDEERLLAESRLAKLRIGLGRHHDAIPRLVKLIEEHPFREELREHLMLALYRSGRQTEALEIYAGTRNLLDEELGVEPGPGLQRLHEAILRAAPELDLPAKQTPRQLPIDVGGFVGRAEQLNALDQMALSNAPILIAGMAGVGKTALAIRWAHQAAHRFSGGQLHLNLNGFSTSAPMQPIEALAMMLRSIGVPAEKVPVEPFEAAALLRTEMAERSMLVLLDNARSADQVRPLLPGGSGNLVLITSRNKLGGLISHEGARRLDLNVLLPEEAHELLDHAVGRARAAAHAPETARLARVCAYLPLALRVAAANLAESPDRTVGSLAAALEHGNRLTSLVVDADDDQAAVRGAFDLSYLDASPAARQIFRLLGLVPGTSFTPHAVAALANTDVADADAQLSRLSNAHLIERVAPDRFTFHDLLQSLRGREGNRRHERPRTCSGHCPSLRLVPGFCGRRSEYHLS